MDIIVTADHGFSGHKGGFELTRLLVDGGFKQCPTSEEIIVVEGAIFIKD